MSTPHIPYKSVKKITCERLWRRTRNLTEGGRDFRVKSCCLFSCSFLDDYGDNDKDNDNDNDDDADEDDDNNNNNDNNGYDDDDDNDDDDDDNDDDYYREEKNRMVSFCSSNFKLVSQS
uniref:Uncharacterized protein n=1 Tax=Vespula pensylvanica TaxID=30213 RepID=A0A834PAR8_VESPE|nr:hypothetical protein H0235_002832 [Vespula pensylvanica]